MKTRVIRRRFLKQTFAAMGTVGIYGIRQASADEAQTVHDGLARAMGRANLTMQFRGSSKKEFSEWQQRFRAKLNELLGDSTPPKDWTATILSRDEFESYDRYDLLLTADGTASLPVYLLVPKSATPQRPAPGVLCVHGHGPYGNDALVGRRDLKDYARHVERLNYDYARQFALRGYVAVAPCMIPFGRRVDAARYGGNDPCAVTFVRMQALGKLPITENIRDLRWSINLLQSWPEVTNSAIGCAGLSYGGRMTMMVTAVDDRIKVASVSGALNLMQERMTLRHSCGSQMIPGLLKYGDYSEIGSLIAPRPCVWETGSRDSLIVPKWDEIFCDRLRRAYEAADAADNLQFDRFDGGHEWSGRIAYPLFDKVLKDG